MLDAAYSIISFISAFICLVLLPWHIRFRDSGLITIIWLFAINLIYGLNAIAFTGDTLLRYPVYCDIATKLDIGLQTLFPTVLLCYILSFHDWLVRPSNRDMSVKHFIHNKHVHIFLCFLAPFIAMTLHIAAQDYRFELIDGVGCLPSMTYSFIGWAITWGLPLIPICLIYVVLFNIVRYLRIKHPRYLDCYFYRLRRYNDAELLFTESPFDSLRLELLMLLNIPIAIWHIVIAYDALAFIVQTDFFAFSKQPSLTYIDHLNSYNTTLGLLPVYLLAWSGPVYTLLFFAARCTDKEVYRSFSFVVNRYILRKPAMNPDPNSDIDLSSLTPIPVRKRLYRRVIRASRMYDAPIGIRDFDIPLPPRPCSGQLKWTKLPPTPKELKAKSLTRSYPCNRLKNTNVLIMPVPGRPWTFGITPTTRWTGKRPRQKERVSIREAAVAKALHEHFSRHRVLLDVIHEIRRIPNSIQERQVRAREQERVRFMEGQRCADDVLHALNKRILQETFEKGGKYFDRDQYIRYMAAAHISSV